MSNLVQYQTDLTQCCGKQPKPKRWLTGIEKQRIEEQETTEMWSELNRGDRQ